MNKANLILIFFFIWFSSYGQWSGNYEGSLNGDKIVMKFSQERQEKVSGEMSDSYQNFKITGDINGNRMAGDAIEQTLGLKFALFGELREDRIEFKLVAKLFGLKSETPFTVVRISGNQSSKVTGKESKPITTVLPKGGTRDPKIVGKWTKNESYNSGYGDNFMGSNFSQSLIFLDDGGVADGGSSANMSGNNYSGSSTSGQGVKRIPDLIWFTKENQLFLTYTQNDKAQTELLGKYYIENGKMLLTLTNGNKILLTR